MGEKPRFTKTGRRGLEETEGAGLGPPRGLTRDKGEEARGQAGSEPWIS